jgi:glycerophosphoryl diester phosphodiesterase
MALWVATASCRAPAQGPLLSGGESGQPTIAVVGHRGAAGLAPENTLSSFARACELGVDAFELDALVSADNRVVVHHDFRLNPALTRSSDGKWLKSASPPRIKDLRLAELKTYDVGRLKPGTRYASRYPDQKPVDGERIPTLREVIGLLKQRCATATQLWVEIKTSPEAPDMTPAPEAVSEMVVKILREENISDRTRILSFDWRNLAHVQKIAPEIPTVYVSREGVRLNNIQSGRPGGSPWMAGLDIDDFSGSIPRAIRAAGGRCWAAYYRNLTAGDLEAAHQLGIEVYGWTPDSRTALKRLVEKGVDGIITNRPDRLKH